jgi:hypothetical protein
MTLAVNRKVTDFYIVAMLLFYIQPENNIKKSYLVFEDVSLNKILGPYLLFTFLNNLGFHLQAHMLSIHTFGRHI